MPEQLRQWLATISRFPCRCEPIAGGAGGRRYYRIWQQEKTWVVMDASDERDSVADFVNIDQCFAQQDIRVPQILAQQDAYLLLEDLGDNLYEQALTPDTADDLYRQALISLKRIQACPLPSNVDFVSQYCQFDLQGWQQWFLERHLGYCVDANEQQLLQTLYQDLQNNATEQAQVCIHRDYHCRNLFALQDGVGVIDFQNAMRGPITYDAVSLLRDCYIDWPAAQVREWVDYYYRLLGESVADISAEQFMRYFDLMGLQRHLKALGTFARKYHRDQDASYLTEIPRTIRYILATCQQHKSLSSFGQWFNQRVENLCTVR